MAYADTPVRQSKLSVLSRNVEKKTSPWPPSKGEWGKRIKVVKARGLHLFPSRTEKLSLVTPMVLRKWESR